jgi:hypothetical protein
MWQVRDDAGAQGSEPIDAMQDLFCRNGFRVIVELVAIGA